MIHYFWEEVSLILPLFPLILDCFFIKNRIYLLLDFSLFMSEVEHSTMAKVFFFFTCLLYSVYVCPTLFIYFYQLLDFLLFLC